MGGSNNESSDAALPPPAANAARDAFFYLLVSTALLATVVSANFLYFSYLDSRFPDPAWPAYREQNVGRVRFALATFLVAFPIFFLLTVRLHRESAVAEKRTSPVRRWLMYATLFSSVVTVASDCVGLLYYFLQGQLTERVVLKALMLLTVAAIIFCHYLLALRPVVRVAGALRFDRLLGALALLLAAGAVTGGFQLAGSPITARLTRLDAQRIDNLRVIERVILEMATSTQARGRTLVAPLPTSLDEVALHARTHPAGNGRRLRLSDPETGEPYEYRLTGKDNFELSAKFALPAESQFDIFWNHPAGRHWFKFNAEEHPATTSDEADPEASPAEQEKSDANGTEAEL